MPCHAMLTTHCPQVRLDLTPDTPLNLSRTLFTYTCYGIKDVKCRCSPTTKLLLRDGQVNRAAGGLCRRDIRIAANNVDAEFSIHPDYYSELKDGWSTWGCTNSYTNVDPGYLQCIACDDVTWYYNGTLVSWETFEERHCERYILKYEMGKYPLHKTGKWANWKDRLQGSAYQDDILSSFFVSQNLTPNWQYLNQEFGTKNKYLNTENSGHWGGTVGRVSNKTV